MINNALISILRQLFPSRPPLCKKKITGNESLDLFEADWMKLFGLASNHGVSSLLFYCLTQKTEVKTNISPEMISLLRNRYFKTTGRYMFMIHELGRVLGILKQEGIPSLVLKGSSIAENYYPSSELRPFSDIDILVRRKDLEKVKDILVEERLLGPKKSQEEFAQAYWYSHSFIKQNPRKLLVEIHWNIAQRRRYQIDIDRIWKDAVPFTVGKTESLMMSREDLVIYLALHLSYHYYNRFLWLIDIGLIVEKERNSLSWEKLVKKCVGQRVRNPVYYTLLYLKNLLLIDIPDEVLKNLKPNPLTDHGIKSLLNTMDLPDSRILNNRLLRYSFSILLIDRFKEKFSFGIEFLNRIPSIDRL